MREIKNKSGKLIHKVYFRHGEPNYLIGANLSGANLKGANLKDAKDLCRIDLSDADLTDADLSNSRGVSMNLRGANLSGANLSDAYLESARPSGANLSNANLTGAYLKGADFRGANLSNANLTGAYLKDANFSGANLTGANFKGANLKKANLENANLSHADFRGANLRGANCIDWIRGDIVTTIENKMKKFKVVVCRTSYKFNDVEIEAETPEQAEAIALYNAKEYIFIKRSEVRNEYSIDGVIEKKKFEIIKTVLERTTVEAVNEEQAMKKFMDGETEVESYPSVGGGDDVRINEL
jgi:uncharacterized protein YjbI with pentapeptide repeats